MDERCPSESIPPTDAIDLDEGGAFKHWFEHLEGTGKSLKQSLGIKPSWALTNCDTLQAGPMTQLSSGSSSSFAMKPVFKHLNFPMASMCGHGKHHFLNNYAPEPVTWNGTEIPPAGVHWEPL